MKEADKKNRSDSIYSFLLRPVPVFLIVTTVTALVSGIPTLKELAASFTTLSYGKVSIFIHLIFPPTVGLMAALGIYFGMGYRLPSAGSGTDKSPGGIKLDPDERARAISRSLSLGMICLSTDCRILSLNPAVYRLFDISEENSTEEVDRFIQEVAIEQLIGQVCKGETFTIEELTYQTKDSPDANTFKITGKPLKKREEVVEILIVIENITSLKALEEELMLSEDRYRNIFNHAQCGIFFVDRHGNYLDANPSALEMLGYSLEELCKLNTREISANSGPRLRKLQATPGWIVEETRYLCKDGTVLDAELTGSSYSTGKGVYFIGIVNDITWKKKLEHKLADVEARLSSTLSSTADALIILDNETRIVELSLPAEKLLDLRTDEIINKPASEVFEADELDLKAPPVSGSFILRTKNGHRETYNCQIIPGNPPVTSSGVTVWLIGPTSNTDPG